MDESAAPYLGPKIGIAFGSGVARGWAHLGVVRALVRYGFKPDIVVGSSIGSLVGGAYLAGHAETLEHWARALTKVRMISYLDFRVGGGGLIGGHGLVEAMNEHMGGLNIEDLGMPFVAIATDLVTGHEVWLRRGNLVKAIRTSFSLPGVFEPVRVNGRWLVDGALVNPVPVSVCRAMGAYLTIAVNVNADLLGKERRADSEIPTIAGFDLLSEIESGAAKLASGGLTGWTKRMLRRDSTNPSMLGVMFSALNIVQDRITRSRLAGEPPDVHITPRLGHIGLMELHRADEIIAEGEAAVERALPDLRSALAVFGRDLGDGDGNQGNGGNRI